MSGRKSANFQFLSVKAFGDLVIALISLERASRNVRHQLSILAGAHLRPLAEALAPTDVPIAFMPDLGSSVPALFDIRRSSPSRVIESAKRLRRAVAQYRDVGSTLVVDKAGPRERWLTWPGNAQALPKAENIYLAYRAFLGATDATPPGPSRPTTMTGRTVGIFPGSRVATKDLPWTLVQSVMKEIAAAGAEPRLALLDGERPDIAESGIPHVLIPRRFEALRAAIEAVDLVISADSLPAHLAERAHRPVFVLSPRPNSYWLPLSPYRAGTWAIFDDLELKARLGRFLEQ